MSALSPYVSSELGDNIGDSFDNKQVARMSCQPFVSLLYLVSEIYQVNCVFHSLISVIKYSFLLFSKFDLMLLNGLFLCFSADSCCYK